MSRGTQSPTWSKRLGLLLALSLVLSSIVAAPHGSVRAEALPRPLDTGPVEPAVPLPPVQGPPPRPSTDPSGAALTQQIQAPPPTPEPTATSAPEAAPVLTLTLAITPTSASPGGGVTLQVSAANLGPGTAAGVVFSMTLPSAVEYQGPVGDVPRLAYDPEHGTLTWQVGSVPPGVGGSFACILHVAQGAEPGEHLFAAALSADPPAKGAAAQARLWVEPAGDAPVRLTPEEGGFLASADGRLEVLVPPAAVTETLLLSYQAVPTSTPELLFSFVLTATSEAGGWAVPALGRPMTLTLSLPAGVGPDVEPVHWDEAQGSWEVVPYHVLSPTLQITATTKELGTFGLLSGGTEQDGTQYLLGPSVRGIQADEFTGGASFSYPIDVPALPGGLALSLGLSYSSEEADGMLTFNGPYEHGSQASWAGLGWSVSGLGRIYRSGARYFLSFAGGSFELVQDAGNAWRTVPHSFLRVEHGGGANAGHWDVWAQDGTKYVFGNPADVWGNGTAYTRWEDCGMPDDKRGYAWHLTKVVDTHGNKVQIDYDHEVGVFHNVCTRDYMRATRPSLLSAYPAGAAAPTVRVVFTPAVEKRADWRLSLGDADTKPWTDTTCQEGAETYGYFFYSCYRLSSVDVQVKQGDDWVSVGSYDLAHETIGNDDPDWHGRYYHIVLRSIQARGTAAAPGTVGPEFPTHYELGYSYAGGEDYEINRSRLTTASNGYGGEVSLAWQYFTTTTPWPECEPVVTYKRYRVASRMVDGGVSGPITTTYAYSGADAGCPTGEQGSPDFFGHAQVEATSKDDGGATLQRSRTTFLQADPVLRGKADLTQVLDAGGLELQATDQAWSSAGGWAQLDSVTTTLHEGGASQASKTVFHYDTFWQNYCTGGTGPQYGHATRVEEYAAADDPAPARTTLSGFCPNATAWIVDKPAFTNLYSGAIVAPPNIPGTGTLQSSTWYIYDNNQDNPDPAWNRAVGSKGELRAVRRTYDWTGAYLLADTRYWHDVYGNVTKEQAYTGYGSSTAWASANPRTTETTYDGTFHTFAVSVDPPLLSATTTQYYGVNGPGLDTTGAYFGRVSSVTDPNNVTVEQVRYDSFGRLVKERRPGDTDWDMPTVETTYTDDYAYGGFQGLKVQQNLREQSGVSGAVQVNFSFYDGLGQLVETLTERTNGAEQVLAYTAYDGLGRVKDAYAPYVVNSDFWNFKAVGAGKPHTTTTYDALGRAVRVTAPDGTYTEHHYGIVDGLTYDDVLDANRHRKQYRYDSFGQLRRVDEIDGNCGTWGYSCSAPYTDEWTVYATTDYEYDVRGSLLQVTDAAGNESTMTYDNLGRKATMADPDMGSWDYGYDAVGNLSRQDDAKHQRTCFYHDDLDRLTGKYYTTDATDCPSNPTCPVSYGYDVGTNGKGRRTSMTDGSGSTSWSYDQRGRTTQESKAITGAPGSTFVTSYSYDAMDRALTMTYPGGEVVQHSYNAAAQLAEVRSTTYALNYATGLAYDALGQLTQMTYGNNAQTRLGYWGTGGAWDSRPGSGLANFGRLYRLRATTGSGGAPLLDLRYNYDPAGNVTQIKEPPAAASGWPTSSFSFWDDFTSKNTTNWWWSAYQVVPDGSNNWVKSVGTGSNYDAHFYRTSYSLSSGQGLQVRLMVSQTDANAHVSIEANDATYRRFGVIAGSGKLSVQYNDGSGYRYPADLLTGLQADTWYVVRIVVDDVRGFYLEAYQESNPTVRGSYNTPMPTGKQWRFHHWNYRGTAYLDTYREFSTAGMTWSPDERMMFGYDWLNRLTSAAPESGAQGYSETYQYNLIGNLENKNGVEYTYPASGQGSVRPHAVGSTTIGGSFGYDSNGNMLSRRLEAEGTTYSQGWDQENRLTSVTGGAQATAMVYDGDGNLVKKTVGSTTTVYIGAYFERTGAVTTSYYYAGSTRVAKRSGGVVTYLHGDHLGSASLATSASGVVVANSSTQYYPYGGTRSGGTGLPTDYRFTGQLLDASSGLYHMGARWYDPLLGRWLSADTVVPAPANPQSLNRYSYVLGNPLGLVDPSGHHECSPTGACTDDPEPTPGERHGEWGHNPPIISAPPQAGPSGSTPVPLPTWSPLAGFLPKATPEPPYWTTLPGHDANRGEGILGEPILFSGGKWVRFLAIMSDPFLSVFWFAVESSVQGTVTYYQNGAYVVVSDSYDASILAALTELQPSLSRQVSIETTAGQVFGPYRLATGIGLVGNTASDPIQVWIAAPNSAPQGVRMRLVVEGILEQAPGVASGSYTVQIPR